MLTLALETWQVVAVVVAGSFFLIMTLLLARLLSLWMQAYFSGAFVSMFDLIGMKLRKVDARVVVLARIRAVKCGVDVSVNELETHYLSGGRIDHVLSALIALRNEGIGLSWSDATAIDLAGRDVLETVRNPPAAWRHLTETRG